MLQTSLVNVVRPCWVSQLDPYNGKWYLSEKGKPCGHFDAIVIAHNGKYLRLFDDFLACVCVATFIFTSCGSRSFEECSTFRCVRAFFCPWT